MKNSLLLGLLLFASCTLPTVQKPEPVSVDFSAPISVRGDQLFVGEEKFLVVGIGYDTGTRPGHNPWERGFEPDRLRADFRRIREAGFNTVRVWSPMTDEELELAAEYGLWVIQGIWFDPGAEFNDPDFQAKTLTLIEREVARSAKHPNILFYLLLNEPHGDAVHRAGFDNMREFYRKLIETARRADPKRLFSYSNCVSTDFIATEMWDIACQNVYPYSPVTIEKALGYRTYLDLYKRQFSGGKPLVITEFGLSVSPRGDGRGYGGNSLEEQRDGVIQLWNDMLNVGCAGGCAFMWLDGWHKYGKPAEHNDHAEEWYGLLEADTDPMGRPRPAYYAFQEYNRAIRTLPCDGATVSDRLDVEVHAPAMRKVQTRIDDGAWVDLRRDGSTWWRGAPDIAALSDGQHELWTRGLDAADRSAGLKHAVFVIDRSGRLATPALQVAFKNLPQRMPLYEDLKLDVEVTNRDGHPLAGLQVRLGRFAHTQWNEFSAETDTDQNGIARFTLPAMGFPGMVSIAAGTVCEFGLLRSREGVYGHVEVFDDRE